MIASNLTSICCVYKEKIVKSTNASIKFQKVAIFGSDRKKINLIPNKSSRYYNRYERFFFDAFVYNPFHNIFLFFVIIELLLKTFFLFRNNEDDIFSYFPEMLENPSFKRNINFEKNIKNIMKYQQYTNASKKNR